MSGEETCPACAGAMPVHHMGAPLQAAHAEHVAAESDLAAELTAAYGEMAALCTCVGPHDDEAECPISPPCTCGRYFDPHCPRHGDPEPLS